MFPTRMFPNRMFAPRMFVKTGVPLNIIEGPYYFEAKQLLTAGAIRRGTLTAGAIVAETFTPGAVEIQIGET